MKFPLWAVRSGRLVDFGFACLLAVLLAAPPAYGTPSDPPLPSLTFSQLDIDFDDAANSPGVIDGNPPTAREYEAWIRRQVDQLGGGASL